MFFHFLSQMAVDLVGDAKRVTWSMRPAMLLARADVNIMHLILSHPKNETQDPGLLLVPETQDLVPIS